MHCVDLGESFPTHIFLKNLASVRPRTSPVKFARKSWSSTFEDLERAGREKDSIFLRVPRLDSPRPELTSGWPGRFARRPALQRTWSGKLDRVRSRLYRGQILQQNMRLKALAEIYTMHSFAPFLESITENWGKNGPGQNNPEKVKTRGH